MKNIKYDKDGDIIMKRIKIRKYKIYIRNIIYKFTYKKLYWMIRKINKKYIYYKIIKPFIIYNNKKISKNKISKKSIIYKNKYKTKYKKFCQYKKYIKK
jgi:hypothetical protein